MEKDWKNPCGLPHHHKGIIKFHIEGNGSRRPREFKLLERDDSLVKAMQI